MDMNLEEANEKGHLDTIKLLNVADACPRTVWQVPCSHCTYMALFTSKIPMTKARHTGM